MKYNFTTEELNSYCDKLLSKLYEGYRLQSFETGFDDDFEKDYIAGNRMVSDGYVVLFGEVNENRSFNIKITPLGISFIALGGYVKQYQEQVLNKKKENRRYWITTGIAIIAILISIIALMLT